MSMLMKPLGSDDLKPRPLAQAAAVPPPPVPVQAEAPAEAQPETLSEKPPESPAVTFAPGTEAQEPAVPAPEAAPPEEEDLLAGFALEEDEDDEEQDVPDAMPSEQMPEPAFVPLYEWNEPAKKKGRGWLWLPVLAALAAGGYALWHYGLADKMWLFIVDKTAAIRYNLSIFIQSFKSPLS